MSRLRRMTWAPFETLTRPATIALVLNLLFATTIACSENSATTGSAYQSSDRKTQAPAISEQDDDSDLMDAELEALRSIGYAGEEEDHDSAQVGVVRHKRDKVIPGYMLYTNKVDTVHLVDMEGREVKRWFFEGRRHCEYAHLLEDGSLLVVFTLGTVDKYDWEGNLLWRRPLRAHHDICVLPSGELWVPVRLKAQPYKGRQVEFDKIVKLSAEGEVLDEWSMFDDKAKLDPLYPTSPLEGVLLHPEEDAKPFDYYHLNAVSVIPETPVSDEPGMRPGNLLLCARNIGLIFILNPETREIEWSVSERNLQMPHHPTMLPGGTILIYDNGKLERGFTRILEIDSNRNIVWHYADEENFYAEFQGSCQVLPNDNILISDAYRGRAFQVTREGEVVWEYFHPEILKNGKRRVLYRCTWLQPEFVEGLLEAHRED